MRGEARRRSWLRHPLAGIVGSAVVLGLLFWALPFGDIAAAIRRVPAGVWPAALVAYLSLHLLGVAKWRLLINTAGAGLSFRDATRAYYMGLFGNTFLPSLVGGDVVRAGVAFGATRSKAGLLLGSGVDRLLDVLGLVALAGVGALLAPRALDPQSRWILSTVGGLLGAACATAWLAATRFPLRWLPFGVRRKLVPVRRALRAMRNPGVLAGALALGMTLQSFLIVLNWGLGQAIGISAPLYVWLFVWPLAKIAGLLPLTQNGFGVREAAQAALFAPFGVSAAMAVAVGLVFDAVILSGGLLGALMAFALSRDRAEREGLRAATAAPPPPG